MVCAKEWFSNGCLPRCNSGKPMAGSVRVCTETGNTGKNGDTSNERQKRFVNILPQASNIYIKRG